MTMVASTASPRRRPRVLLGVTGSVAAIKAPEIVNQLVDQIGADVRVLLTSGGSNFWNKAETYNPSMWKRMQELLKDTESGSVIIHDADEEWRDWKQLGDPVLHVDLRDWADIMLIAPLSAHSLAKIAQGLCDDTLSCVVRAWDWGHGTRPGKPLLLAPAMNTAMWEHPVTRIQLQTIQSFWNSQRDSRPGAFVVAPQIKTLACGEVGDGGLASVDEIVKHVREVLERITV